MSMQQRLQTIMRSGNLRVADLVRWLERPDPTVRGWVNGTEPWLSAQDADDVERRLTLLERSIKSEKHLPLPPRLSPSERGKRLARARTELRL